MSRLIGVLVFVSMAVHGLSAAHRHDDGGLFSENCPLARLAHATAETTASVAPHPGVVLDRQALTVAVVTETVPTEGRSVCSARAPPSA